MSGKLISFEGVDKTGKSTQASRLADWLHKERKIKVLLTREPGGSALGEAARGWLLQQESADAKTEALVLMAARRAHWRERIAPALQRGVWVVCDRFADSTLAYQHGGGDCPKELIDVVHKHILDDDAATPALTFYLRVAAARLPALEGGGRKGGDDSFERRDADFFERVIAGYDAIAAANPKRVRALDVFFAGKRQTPEELEMQARQHINREFFAKRARRPQSRA